MVNVYGTDAIEFAVEKLGFVEEFAEGEVDVRIKNTKASDLRVASITYRFKGSSQPTHIESGEHRAVAKCVLELADKASVKIAKDKDKYEARKRKRRRKAEKARLEALKAESVKHDWEPTDTEGHAMTCQGCGLDIAFANREEWSANVDATCSPSLAK